jgi:general stress protein YciG
MEDFSLRRPRGGKIGFAAMDPVRQREIARKGGKAGHEKGTAHEFTPDEAREAGKIGGAIIAAHEGHMAKIGKMGGKASREKPRPRKKS